MQLSSIAQKIKYQGLRTKAAACMEGIAQELGLSKERIRQLEAQALAKLRRRLESTTGSAAELLTSA